MVYVGPGTPAQAAAFAAVMPQDAVVRCDPERRAFVAAGMRRGAVRMLHPRFLANLVRALWRGHRQQGVRGDPWQLGGVVVLGPDGALRHRQVDRTAGDTLDLEAVFAALPSPAVVPAAQRTASP